MGLKLSAHMNARDWEGSYEFDQSRVSIGRGASSDVQLPDATVSTFHASVRVKGSSYGIVDENSSNGVFVNGERIAAGRAKPLRSGDRIGIGAFIIEVQIGAVVTLATSSDKTAALARQFIRQALGEDLKPSRFTILNGPDTNKVLELPNPPSSLLVGRGESCDVRLNDEDASREHAEINVGAFGTTVRDLESKNGIEVNGQPVVQRLLKDRDELQVGATLLVYEEPAQEALGDILELPDSPVMAESLTEWEKIPSASAAPEAEEAPLTEVDHDPIAMKVTDSVDAPAMDASVTKEGAETVTAADSSSTDPLPSKAHEVLPQRRQSGINADLIIYAMAAAIVIISIAGLFWLFTS